MNKQKRYTPSVSLKESERNWLKQQAEKAGMSYTRYMKEVALGKQPQAEKTLYKDQHELEVKGMTVDEFDSIIRKALIPLGNNMNQVVRRLNSGRPVDDKVAEIMDDIRVDCSKIAEVILRIK